MKYLGWHTYKLHTKTPIRKHMPRLINKALFGSNVTDSRPCILCMCALNLGIQCTRSCARGGCENARKRRSMIFSVWLRYY